MKTTPKYIWRRVKSAFHKRHKPSWPRKDALNEAFMLMSYMRTNNATSLELLDMENYIKYLLNYSHEHIPYELLTKKKDGIKFWELKRKYQWNFEK